MNSNAGQARDARLALLAGAVVWGLVWYPYRVIEAAGVDGISASVLTYAVALLAGLVPFVRARRWRGVRPGGALVVIALASAGCNIGYVLATLEGVVMRVLLLFYLSPLWTVLLARVLLGERLGRAGAAVVALSLAGAVTMLWRPEMGSVWPASVAEWTGLAAGFLFALANVMIRRTHELPIDLKCLAVFAGAVVLGGALLAAGVGAVPARMPDGATLGLIVLTGLVLLVINHVVQFGLTHTPATQAIVIFLFELVVAAASSWLLAGEAMGAREWLGGALIVAASVLSGRVEARLDAAPAASGVSQN